MHEIADAALEPLMEAFALAAARARKALDLPSLAEAIAAGDADLAAAAISRARKAFRESLEKTLPDLLLGVLVESGKDAGARAKVRGDYRGAAAFRAAEVTLAFDETNPMAAAWARERAGELIDGLDETTLDRLRGIIGASFDEGFPPRETARRIEDELGEDFEERAMIVARTETIRASAEGERQLWLQAEEEGLLTGDEMREWITGRDDRACEDCLAMDGELAALDEPFILPWGEPVDGPPAHPNCRCSHGLTTKEWSDALEDDDADTGIEKIIEDLEPEELDASEPDVDVKEIDALIEPEPDSSHMDMDHIARLTYDENTEKIGEETRKILIDPESAKEALDHIKLKETELEKYNLKVKLPFDLDPNTEIGRAKIACIKTSLMEVERAQEFLWNAGVKRGVRVRIEFIEGQNEYASADQRAIYINLAQPAWVSELTLERAKQRDFSSGFHSSPDSASGIIHEFGHNLHFQSAAGKEIRRQCWNPKDGSYSWEELERNRAVLSYADSKEMERTASEVCRYAKRDPLEFVAETFTGIGYGNKYSDRVMNLYDELGGPILTRPFKLIADVELKQEVKEIKKDSAPIPGGNLGDEIMAVLRMRNEGATYQEIEKSMGWKDSHGNRPWRIVKKYGG